MFKINFHLIVYRYELILVAIVLILAGSAVVSSKDRETKELYPYKIALTFDDGPHPYYTDKIVSILQNNNAKGSFFIVGRLAMEYPYLIQQISLAGNEVDIHTFTHRNLSKLKDDEIRRELSITASLIKDISNQKSIFFRPPGGQYNKKVLQIAGDLNQNMILWTVFPKDHEEDDPEVILKTVLRQAGDCGVVLLHSGRPATLQALPKIIQELRNMGYQFVTVSELKNYTNKPAQFAWYKKTQKEN